MYSSILQQPPRIADVPEPLLRILFQASFEQALNLGRNIIPGRLLFDHASQRGTHVLILHH